MPEQVTGDPQPTPTGRRHAADAPLRRSLPALVARGIGGIVGEFLVLAVIAGAACLLLLGVVALGRWAWSLSPVGTVAAGAVVAAGLAVGAWWRLPAQRARRRPRWAVWSAALVGVVTGWAAYALAYCSCVP
ncbi:hypothetical protein [Cellulomonas fimi]|uniref:hypothetical protein n=1 Tax=Cellulomonas fimi TaxID=1708 RepID=UPI002359ECB2|nr:hypothetical protein [Cellulomonas fimi]